MSLENLKSMLHQLRHRGPDAEGLFEDGALFLGHRRLSILDLSTDANQPFHSRCGRYVIVYNGEVYNFQELNNEWRLTCRTRSDTEVILEGFVAHGPAIFSKLNGMFALAIFDRQDRVIYLARDRIGIKPLFYTETPGGFAFASELKAIRALPLDFTISREAVSYFLRVGYIPAPLTIYNEVSKFPQGHWGVFNGAELKVFPFWRISEGITFARLDNEEDALHELEGLLRDSVRQQMISDVPLGTFLSGGIDSSLVTALAQSLSTQPLKTFSIGFEDPQKDESVFARRVAQHLGTEHHEIKLEESRALDLLTQLPEVYDEPFADTSAAPTMLVSEMARRHVTVTLSGDGGDELFLGYGAYTWAERLANPVLWHMRRPLSLLFQLGSQRWQRAGDLLNVPNRASVREHIFSQEQYLFSKSQVDSLLACPVPTWPLDATLPSSRQLTPAELQAVFDLQFYLPDDLLTKVDRASMTFSLESRVPLLDNRLIDFALNLSPQLRARGVHTKYLLKKVLYRHLPQEYFNRPKRGFSIPLARWLQTELRELSEAYLSKDMVEKVGALKWDEVNQVKRKFYSGQTRLYNRVWALIVLHQAIKP